MDYLIEYHKEILPKEEAALFHGINEEAMKRKGMEPICPFAFLIKEKDEILGGVKGITYYGCIYVDMLWIVKDFRQKGLGSRLMQEVENLGKKRKCSFATVNTMDWEALPFYQKLGYKIEFIREGYEKSSKMFMLRKSL